MPKPVIPTNVLAPKPPCLVQTPCAKTAKSCAFCDCTPEFYGGILYWLLEKQGKLYFLQSSQTKGRGVLLHLVTPVLSAVVCKSSRIRHSPNSGTVRRFPVLPTPCAKTREFGEAEFSDCLPVSDLVCVFAFDTGGLGLWLGALGRSRLYRCQSVPGPPMPVFCGTELRFCRLCNFDLPNKQRFSLQRHKSCKKRCFLR